MTLVFACCRHLSSSRLPLTHLQNSIVGRLSRLLRVDSVIGRRGGAGNQESHNDWIQIPSRGLNSHTAATCDRFALYYRQLKTEIEAAISRDEHERAVSLAKEALDDDPYVVPVFFRLKWATYLANKAETTDLRRYYLSMSQRFLRELENVTKQMSIFREMIVVDDVQPLTEECKFLHDAGDLLEDIAEDILLAERRELVIHPLRSRDGSHIRDDAIESQRVISLAKIGNTLSRYRATSIIPSK
ncbi:hypothetical protein JOL62DRAFT_603599 [Phyllosticta paracitricarpa]|uniref:Uncharacterized protein n=1 Tax=Phyllosticta paracitricarpa TaxID=2016321 RepID=A0ABR1NC91_9PEZI